jgi:hypothetical protein
MNLSDYNIGDNAPQTCLFIGDSGTGKSIAAADWPGPTYIASCDNRMGSVAEWHRGRKDITFDNFVDFESLNSMVDQLEGEWGSQFKTVVCPDPITMVSDFLMRYAFSLRGTVEYDETTGKATKGSKGKKKGVVDITTVEDFNVEHRGILDMLANLKVAQKKHGWNLIVTAHLITTQYTKPGGTESHIRRDIVTAGKKVAAFIPIQFDEIYHFYCEDGRYKIKTYNDGIVAARSSFLLMPKEIDWSDSNLYEKLSKYYIKSEGI